MVEVSGLYRIYAICQNLNEINTKIKGPTHVLIKFFHPKLSIKEILLLSQTYRNYQYLTNKANFNNECYLILFISSIQSTEPSLE